MSNRLTIKGQVTVPKEIREYLGLAGGCDCVDFSVAGDGTVILTKAEPKPRREMPAFAAGRRVDKTEVRRCAADDIIAVLAGS